MNHVEFDRLFCLAKTSLMPDISCRISALHAEVYHGQGEHPEANASTEDPKPIPAVSNDYREPLHITRSGRFVPSLFLAGRKLVVNERIYRKLRKIKNIVGEQVVFEKLVDLPMPKLGDMSYYDRDVPYKDDPLPMHEYGYLDDVPEFHKKIGHYYEILPALPRDLLDAEIEWKEVLPNFGSYPGTTMAACKPKKIAREVMERFPIYKSGIWFLRQDIFTIIAPHLDLDYFAVDMMQYNKI